MRIVTIALVAAAALAATGCQYWNAWLDSPVERHWGEAVTDTSSAQVANPAGSGSPGGPSGLDPVSGEVAAKGYYDRQRSQPAGPAGPSLILQEVR